jgi:ATP-dependent DNA helicase DinG
MILALKQGFGRLIRTKTDRGVVAVLDNRLSTKRYGSTVLRSLPPARTTQRFGDVFRFFGSPFYEADYALTVWVEDGDDTVIPYRWRLTRLPDGRSRDGTGVATTEYGARWAGISTGVQSLQAAIQNGGRDSSDFGLEIRLPATSGRPSTLLQGAPPDLSVSLQSFSEVRLIQIEGSEDR